jgi:hypothetical protein
MYFSTTWHWFGITFVFILISHTAAATHSIITQHIDAGNAASGKARMLPTDK